MRTNTKNRRSNSKLKRSKLTRLVFACTIAIFAFFLHVPYANALPGLQDDTMIQSTANTVAAPCCLESNSASLKKASLVATHLRNMTVDPADLDVPMTIARTNKVNIQLADRAMDMHFRDNEVAAFRAATFKKDMEEDIRNSDNLMHNDFSKWSVAAYFSFLMQINAEDASIDMLLMAPRLQQTFQKEINVAFMNSDFNMDQILLISYLGKINKHVMMQADESIDQLFQANTYIP